VRKGLAKFCTRKRKMLLKTDDLQSLRAQLSLDWLREKGNAMRTQECLVPNPETINVKLSFLIAGNVNGKRGMS
jgi:hypothetical protein